METLVETKKVAVAKVPSGATAVLYAALVEGVPTEAQIETGRNALAATLEIVGATNASSFLTRLPAEKLADGETLRLDVAASTVKVSPDPLPDAEAEPLDETSLEVGGETDAAESESNEEVANESNVESDATSTDAAAIDETVVEPETSEA